MAGKNSVFVNNSAPSVDDTYLNLYKTENNNIITGSGQSLSDAVNNQMAIGVSRFAANNFYIDSGVADAYVLTLAASFTNPVSATVGYFVGMTIRFRAGNAGTGGAATVNVNGAGVKSLKEADGSTNPSSIPTIEDTMWRYDGTVFRKVNVTNATETSSGIALLPKQITITNNSGTPNTNINFSAGSEISSDGTTQMLATAMTKILQASGSWAAGSGQNMLLTGARANSSTYHLFLIKNPTTGAVDFAALLGVAGTTPDPTAVLPSGYTKYKRICSILTDASGNIIPGSFIFGNGFYYFIPTTPTLAVDVSAQGTSAVNYTIPTPLGVKTTAFMNISTARGATGTSMYFSDPDLTNLAPSTTVAPLGQLYMGVNDVDRMQTLEISTNTSSQIRTRWSVSDGSTTMKIVLTKFLDITN